MNVLIIPEDPLLDQEMLRPLIKAALKYKGCANPNVRVYENRTRRGDAAILKFDAVKEVIVENLMYDNFILCVDRDCRTTRPKALENLEKKIQAEIGRAHV